MLCERILINVHHWYLFSSPKYAQAAMPCTESLHVYAQSYNTTNGKLDSS